MRLLFSAGALAVSLVGSAASNALGSDAGTGSAAEIREGATWTLGPSSTLSTTIHDVDRSEAWVLLSRAPVTCDNIERGLAATGSDFVGISLIDGTHGRTTAPTTSGTFEVLPIADTASDGSVPRKLFAIVSLHRSNAGIELARSGTVTLIRARGNSYVGSARFTTTSGNFSASFSPKACADRVP